jgi:hypothetical protein
MVIDLLGLTPEQVRERYPEVYAHLSRPSDQSASATIETLTV